jgi:hypothetical protein
MSDVIQAFDHFLRVEVQEALLQFHSEGSNELAVGKLPAVGMVSVIKHRVCHVRQNSIELLVLSL